MEFFLKAAIGVGLTIVLNLIIDYFVLRESEDLISFPKEIIKSKERLYSYIISVIAQTIVISFMGVNLVGGLYYIVALIFYKIAVIDYKTTYVDNKLLVLLAITSFISLGIDNGVSIFEGIITGVIAFLILGAFSKVTNGAFGMGDAKVLALLGIIFGIGGLLAIMCIASIVVFLISIVLLIKSRKNAKKELPFTPYLFLSLIVMIIINNI